MSLLLILFQTAHFAIELESAEQCAAVLAISKLFWQASEQVAIGYCFASVMI